MSDYEKTMEELLRCPLCQHVLTEPRQLPCGHSLCLGCVKDLGDASCGAPLRCPLCQAEFWPPVELRKSYTLSSIAEDFRQNSRERAAVPRVACDCCRGKGQPAVRSCLRCEVSLCQEHARDHEQLPAFRRHPLVNAVPDLGRRKCPRHDDEVLRYYCDASRRYLCVVCVTESRQREHLSEACGDVQRALTENMNTHFSTLKTQLRNCVVSIHNLQDIVQKKKKDKVPSFTMAVLPLLLIVLFYAYHYSVENRTLQDTVYNQQKNMERIVSQVAETFQYQPTVLQSLENMDSEGFCRLDLHTAHNHLQVSNDLKTVERVATKINYPDATRRFTLAPQVMSIHCFSTGVRTWQVQAEGYWDVAVSYRSLNLASKKGSIFGQNRKSWSLAHNSNGRVSAYHNNKIEHISDDLQVDQVAVMVDIERGNITFASVEPTVTRLHEFKANLTEPVCLGLGLYRVSPTSRATVLTFS